MSVLDDRTLEDLRSQDPSDIRRWLHLHQPASGDERGFWWENVATRSLQALYQSQDESDPRPWAMLVAATTDEAVDQGVLEPTDGAIRLANLAAFLIERGSDVFDPNVIADRCLSLITLPFEEVARKSGDWRSLPRAEIAELRKIKNLVSPLIPLGNWVTNATILEEVEQWRGLRELLP
ncbi:hypothetical protein GCM10022251_79030 [Phytohabitans flavus]|uniref:Uncharacterized protein n=1 Tax=Phytohabitans flavus TaxID=1076124 RepID=A0A6F8XLT9_9ACTN|nr:hypothetical protein [Phytohabitans flavus]BCB74775.1 hypothetical protein Pflav_011850 [Phytohabitans flavus]